MIFKRTLTILFFLAIETFSYGQQITVVSPEGDTSIYTSLDNAIKEANSGSTLYLSGGVFQINDSTKIKKKLNIIGIGHRPNNDNADGNTNVSGNLFFEAGSGNSSVLGIYLGGDINSGNINIGTSENAVNSILVRFVNVKSIQVLNSGCQGVLINQCYLRNRSNGGGSTIHFSNNVISSLSNIKAGVVEHNVFAFRYDGYGTLAKVYNSQIRNNILIDPKLDPNYDCSIHNNMLKGHWGENSVGITKWEDEFEGLYNDVNPTFNYHLKSSSAGKAKAIDRTDIGIYGGSGFSDKALPPGPRIVKKIIAYRTDANGNLPVQIELKTED